MSITLYHALHKQLVSIDFVFNKMSHVLACYLSIIFLQIVLFSISFYYMHLIISMIQHDHIEHKLVMVGLDNAGKTTILYQFLMNEVVHTSPTIGSNVEEIVWKNIHFLVWDLAGKKAFLHIITL